MKTYTIVIIGLMIPCFLFSQTPQALNYQGVARDITGNPIGTQNIKLRVAILQTSPNGAEVYSETHSIQTNNLGLFSIQIGNGNIENGVFINIDWGSDDHFLQIEMDENGGSNYQLLGTSQLLSVPYALMSKKTGIVQSNNASSVVAKELVTFPLSSSPENTIFNVWVSDTTQYDPDQQQLQGLTIFHQSAETKGDVSLKLSSRSTETFGTQNLHAAATVVLNAVATGRDQADFTIQNEYLGPNLVRETFRVKHNGNIGIGTSNPVSKLQVTDGDIYIEDINKGVIMKAPNGQCWRMTIDNNGDWVKTQISCPN